jgi:dienelactone hydrolase
MTKEGKPMNGTTTLRALLTITLLTAAAPAPAQAPGGPPDAPPPRATPPGPYAVAIESYPSLATHTVYQPADLAQFGGRNLLPIVSWGNGGCARVGTAFAGFLSQIASHGYIAIAVGAKDAKFGPPANETLAQPRADAPTPPLDDHLLIDAIDWAIAQNGDASSPLHGKLDTSRIAVMGQSCGGLQTLAVSDDPRITTSVLWNSGALPPNAPTPGGRVLSAASKDSLQRLHAPIAYFIGGPSDVAYPNAEDDFARITSVPVFKANLNVGHGGTYRDTGGGWFGEVAVAWLDWRLKGSQAAAGYFVGADCRLCTNPLWKVAKKGMR